MSKAQPNTDRIEWWPRENIRPNPNNVRVHDDSQIEDLAASMRELGWTVPMLVTEDPENPRHGMIVGGHARFEASERVGLDQCRVIVAQGWTSEQIDRYALFDNQIALRSTWDEKALVAELSRIREMHGKNAVLGAGFTQASIDAYFAPKAPAEGPKIGSLSEEFGVPPFSVIDTKGGWWQGRKRGWLRLGIKSELGRGDNDPPVADKEKRV